MKHTHTRDRTKANSQVKRILKLSQDAKGFTGKEKHFCNITNLVPPLYYRNKADQTVPSFVDTGGRTFGFLPLLPGNLTGP